MAQLHKHKLLSIIGWVSADVVNRQKSSFSPSWSLSYSAENPRFYRTKRAVQVEDSIAFDESFTESRRKNNKRFRVTRKVTEAQAALLDYFHSTRGVEYSLAEYISKNSPRFLGNLLAKVDDQENIVRSVKRFLLYHPINEFEPFFESFGFKPHEYGPLLPRGLTYLSDDELLFKNYQVLFNYGIAINMIGKIYREAREVFQYSDGFLEAKFRTYQELGFDRSFVCKMVACHPCLLIGDAHMDFAKVIEILNKVGIEFKWIEEHLAGESINNWSHLLSLLNLFMQTGYSEKQFFELISQHLEILFEGSGSRTFSLFGFLIKFGSPMNQISSMFLQFPKMQVGKFISNLRCCFLFLNEIEMEAHEIGKIFRAHPTLLGSCTLKKTNSLLTVLNTGKKRLCELIQENPEEMKKWVMGSRVEPLPNSGEDTRSRTLKIEFLKEIGLKDNSKEMEKALKAFRGKGTEMKGRFECIVKAGVDRKDVCKMLTVAPQILNLKEDVIKMKLDFLLNDLGYPLSSLVAFPSILSRKIPRVKSRLAMYDWLKEQGLASPTLSLSTVIACTDQIFVKTYVNRHHRGPEVWEDLKKKYLSE